MSIFTVLVTVSILAGCVFNFDSMPEKTYQTISTPTGNVIVIIKE